MFEEKFESAKRELKSVLSKYVSYEKASKYSDDYAYEFVETGAWTENSLKDLKSIGIDYGETNKHGYKYDHPVFNAIAGVIGRHVLTFAERARLELERDESELSPEEAERRKADLLALEEMETLCNGNVECKVTKEHYELFSVLTEGFDPDNFKDCRKPKVTKEEVAQFRELGKKFGLNESTISKHIDFTLKGTPSALAQRLVSQQTVIDEKRMRDHLILTQGSGAFRDEKRMRDHLILTQGSGAFRK